MNTEDLQTSSTRLRQGLFEGLVAVAGGLPVLFILLTASPDALDVTAVFVSLGVVMLSLRSDRWLLGAVVLVGAWWLAVVAARYLPDVINPQPSVSQAVGGAAFVDTPYQGAQIGAVASVAIPALVALAATAIGVLGRWSTQRSNDRAADGPAASPAPAVSQAPAASPAPAASRAPAGPPAPAASPAAADSPTSAGGSGRSAAMWIGAAIIAFTLVPDLRDYLSQSSAPLPYDWDTSNLTAWQGLITMGLVPMKDFFYPYGFQWLFTLRSFGPIFLWLAQIALLAIAAWSLWRLSGGRTWPVLACLLALVLIGAWTAETWRYVPALLIPVSYAALGPLRHARAVRGHWVFGAACLLAALIEPDLLGLGLVGAVLVALGELVAGELKWDGGRLLLRVAVDAAPVLAAVIALVLIWVATGTAAGNWRFFTDLTAVSAQSAPDERTYGPLGLMVLYPNAYSLDAAVPALLVAAGLLWARLGGRHGRAVRSLLLGAAGVSLMLLLKNFVRPVGVLVLIPALAALSWSVILTWNRGSLARAAAGGAAIAAVLALLNQTAAVSTYLNAAVTAPVHAVRSVLVVFDRSARVRAAVAQLSTARFRGWPDAVIAQYYAGTVTARPSPRFAIIGDSQMTYVFFRQPPPYQIDLYDAGRLAEQRVMLADLQRERPPYLIWRRDFDVDGVLYDIRDPLIFAWMIRNYVPVRSFPTVDVLRRRPPGEAVPDSFWLAQLGAVEDLEYIPSLSDAAQSPTCSSGATCVRYAMVHGRAAGGSLVTVSISGNGHSYEVTFRVRAGVRDYPVRLDRLWFSQFIGSSPEIRAVTPGFSAHEVGRRSGGNLY